MSMLSSQVVQSLALHSLQPTEPCMLTGLVSRDGSVSKRLLAIPLEHLQSLKSTLVFLEDAKRTLSVLTLAQQATKNPNGQPLKVTPDNPSVDFTATAMVCLSSLAHPTRPSARRVPEVFLSRTRCPRMSLCAVPITQVLSPRPFHWTVRLVRPWQSPTQSHLSTTNGREPLPLLNTTSTQQVLPSLTPANGVPLAQTWVTGLL